MRERYHIWQEVGVVGGNDGRVARTRSLETPCNLLCIPALWACMTTLPTPPVIHLTRRLPRLAHDDTSPMLSDSFQNNWWTTSGGSTFLPTASEPSQTT